MFRVSIKNWTFIRLNACEWKHFKPKNWCWNALFVLHSLGPTSNKQERKSASFTLLEQLFSRKVVGLIVCTLPLLSEAKTIWRPGNQNLSICKRAFLLVNWHQSYGDDSDHKEDNWEVCVIPQAVKMMVASRAAASSSGPGAGPQGPGNQPKSTKTKGKHLTMDEYFDRLEVLFEIPRCSLCNRCICFKECFGDVTFENLFSGEGIECGPCLLQLIRSVSSQNNPPTKPQKCLFGLEGVYGDWWHQLPRTVHLLLNPWKR